MGVPHGIGKALTKRSWFPDSKIAFWKSTRPEFSNIPIKNAPEDSPTAVTFLGSPPNLNMLFWTHSNILIESYRPSDRLELISLPSLAAILTKVSDVSINLNKVICRHPPEDSGSVSDVKSNALKGDGIFLVDSVPVISSDYYARVAWRRLATNEFSWVVKRKVATPGVEIAATS